MYCNFTKRVLLLAGAYATLTLILSGDQPAWWTDGNPPVITGDIENNRGPANVGQAKWMARRALEELQEILPNADLAGDIEGALVGDPAAGKIIPFSEWEPPVDQAGRDRNRAPLLVGQLKAIAHPFYHHLHQAVPHWLAAQRIVNGTESGGTFPWTEAPSDDNNRGVANTGQLKAVFALRFETLLTYDHDGDGLPDWDEHQLGTDPTNPDSDGDGVPDGEEDRGGTGSNDTDSDGDGLNDLADADPHDPVVDWGRVAGPSYVFVPLTGVPSDQEPRMVNAEGAVLFDRGVWEGGTWTLLQDDGLSNFEARGMNDNGVIVGFGIGDDPEEASGNVVSWPDKGTPPGFVRSGSDYASAHEDLAAGSTYAGSILANDGTFIALAYEEMEDEPDEYLYRARWNVDGTHSAVEPWASAINPDGAVFGNGNVSVPGEATQPFAQGLRTPFRIDLPTGGSKWGASTWNTSAFLLHEGSWVNHGSLAGVIDMSASGVGIMTGGRIWHNGEVSPVVDLCSNFGDGGWSLHQEFWWEEPLIDINEHGVILVQAKNQAGAIVPGLLLPVEVVELSPKVKDEDGNEIDDSEKPNEGKPLTPFVEEDPHANRIAHRELKVRIGEALEGRKVTWTLEPLFVPHYDPNGSNPPPTFRGEWLDSPVAAHQNAFEASSAFGANGFEIESGEGENTVAKTTVADDGFTAIRVNVPPIGFNQARIRIQIEGTNEPIDLIDMEVPAVVVVDPGHGGNDSGAVGRTDNSVRENDLALAYGINLREELIDKFNDEKHGLKVIVTRENDVFVELGDRAPFAKDGGADVFVSIHFNSGSSSARGTETLVRGANNTNEPEDTNLANLFLSSTFAAVQSQDGEAIDRGVKNYAWSETQQKNVPSQWAVLSDAGYGNTAEYSPVRGAIIEVEFVSHEAALETVRLSSDAGIAIRSKFGTDVATDIFDNIHDQQ